LIYINFENNKLGSIFGSKNVYAMGILHIDSDTTSNLTYLRFDDIINHFSEQKAKKFL
jgi:hypothetical protein